MSGDPSPDAERPFDLLVVGSGVAGLTAVTRAPNHWRVGLVTKAKLADSATQWAQGGVAAVLPAAPDPGTPDPRRAAPPNESPPNGDSTRLHLADTLAAGAGLCDLAAVEVLVNEGPLRVAQLAASGAVFDRDEQGRLELAREGGHSFARVLHAGGAATGAEIERALLASARDRVPDPFEGWFAFELLVDDGTCIGVAARAPDGSLHNLRARHTLLASGGAGQLFRVTTNPPQSTGDGLAMALRAGVAVADLEFVQFHPTALHDARTPRVLLSEALRGHGAVLRDADGERFVDELAPRDVVSRAMAQRMAAQGVDHLWLDATALDDFAARFPTLVAPLAAVALDPSRDWLPVAPAAHYFSGGALTDLDGATTLPGLWAAGEAACTGVHGANRLASNSLLEGLVFAARVVAAIDAGKTGPSPTGPLAPLITGRSADSAGVGAVVLDSEPSELGLWPVASGNPHKAVEQLQEAMTAGAGVVRSADSLSDTARRLRAIARVPRAGRKAAPALPAAAARSGEAAPTRPADLELANLAVVADVLLSSALAREESRGSHGRTDFPETSPSFHHRLVHWRR